MLSCESEIEFRRVVHLPYDRGVEFSSEYLTHIGTA